MVDFAKAPVGFTNNICFFKLILRQGLHALWAMLLSSCLSDVLLAQSWQVGDLSKPGGRGDVGGKSQDDCPDFMVFKLRF